MIRKSSKPIKRTRIQIKQTIATLLCEEAYVQQAYREILKLRCALEKYIAGHPDFASSLIPVERDHQAPEIIQSMIRASEAVGSGPMAAVAGAISEYTVRALVNAGAGHVVLDNGGDIAMKINRPVVVGVFTGQARISNIGLHLEPDDEIFGICTSSGTIGHSLSFGCADAALVISRDICLADALATVLGNHIRDKSRRNMQRILSMLMREDVTGMMVVADDVMGFCGRIPPLVKADVCLNKISRG